METLLKDFTYPLKNHRSIYKELHSFEFPLEAYKSTSASHAQEKFSKMKTKKNL